LSGCIFSVFQGVALRCSALQCVAVRCGSLKCVAVCCRFLNSVLHYLTPCCMLILCLLLCVAVRCSALQSVLQSALQCVAVSSPMSPAHIVRVAGFVVLCRVRCRVCCSVLQCLGTCLLLTLCWLQGVLQRVAVCCRVPGRMRCSAKSAARPLDNTVATEHILLTLFV